MNNNHIEVVNYSGMTQLHIRNYNDKMLAYINTTDELLSFIMSNSEYMYINSDGVIANSNDNSKISPSELYFNIEHLLDTMKFRDSIDEKLNFCINYTNLFYIYNFLRNSGYMH